MVNVERIPRDIVVVGASAGGVEALRKLFSEIPGSFPGVVAAVLHRHPLFESDLPKVLGRSTSLRLVEPEDETPMERGVVYIAPRDRHLRFEDSTLRVERGPKEHFTRPAVDPLFVSAARSFGKRVVGIVLTGGGDDGVDGLIAIKAAGGLSIAQDPSEAMYPFMPRNAILYDRVDLVLRISAIAVALVDLAAGRCVLEGVA
jgi:two-component system, chemotaxis family, protein-glutamate methylesterase/glutaminase